MGSGLVTIIVILMFVLSFALYMGTPDHSSSMFFSILAGKTNLFNQFKWLVTIGIGTVLVAGLLGFPNQYLIFAGITVLLLGFITLPTDLLVSTTLPTEIKTFIVGIFSFLYILGLINWYKGTGEM